jgi:hypothetical protein
MKTAKEKFIGNLKGKDHLGFTRVNKGANMMDLQEKEC